MEEFKHMTPKELGYCVKGHQERIKEQDYLAWLFNQYTLSAVSVAVEHNLAGRKARSKYIEKPLLQEVENRKKEITEKDIQMAILTEQKYMAMAVNRGLPETIIK